MRIRFGLKQFSVTSDGRTRQFSWLWLLPMAAVPVILLVSLALFDDPLVSQTIRRARYQPKARGEAIDLFVRANRTALENLVASEPPLPHSDIPTLELEVPKNTLEAMQTALRTGDPMLSHLPGGDQPYFNATLKEDDGDLLGGEVCLRGLSAWHHHPEKPSLRFKIKKDDVRGDRRYVELSRPEDVLALKNWIPDQLGSGLGLLSDFSDHVRVFVNNKYLGVYLRSMRADESLSLRNGRMPGSFFKGEFRDDWSQWDKDKAFADLWGTSPDGWRSSLEEEESNWPLFHRFLDTLREERGPESLARLEGLLDMEVYAKWAAVMVVTGSSHTDGFHNQVFYFDPNHGSLEAVPWDSNAYGMHSDARTPPDLVLHPVMEFAISDPRWVHRRNQIVRQLLETTASAAELNLLIDRAVDRMLPDLKADMHLSSLELMPDLIPWSVLDIEPKRREIKEWAAERGELLRKYLADAQVFIEESSERPGWSRVDVAGSVAVRVARADGADPEADTWAGDPTLLYPGLSAQLSDYISTPFKKSSHKAYAHAVPLTYFVRGAPGELSFTNAITDSPVVPRSGRFDGLPGEVRTIHPSRFEAPKTGDVVLGPGEVLMEEDLHVGAAQRLLIRAGTRIRLKEGVGIYSRGQTLVQGTPDAPVELLAAGAEPWACFGVSGLASRGSRFESMIASGGSTGNDAARQFKGMFNVYESDDVVLRNCRFGRNEIGDDTVNLASSTILVEDCEWNDSLSDALDLDMCRGLIRRCHWRNSGNDGLDLMAGRITVRDCSFEGSGDKGVSVGEDTQLDLRDCIIRRCLVGMEVKDRSHALVTCTSFQGNNIGAHAYQKKWLFGVGGSIALVSCEIEGSLLEDLSIEKRCRAYLVDTPVGGFCEGVERIATLGFLADDWNSLASIAP
ncbi:MAG TPA: CotH kinase family protein [Planctomycetota bacterium]|nr:CotH kinase family protein [Planctomycetota bacterium]